MKLSLLVIRTQNPEALKSQYEYLGMTFEYHKHDKGPYHYACETKGFVFEIYPLPKSMTTADASLRLGFDIHNLSQTLEKLKNSNWIIQSEVKETPWGRTAIVQDLDGRKVELKDTVS
ncbi:hypothetical protein [uncultured Dokdonia sp.]|uniref:hypothetical protein n=1 Tax=uncultured Dokdonia sp. TaxID=575653 RepID=UPI00262C7C4A|nr:hypothetical protein [uncultured Dokdonia sp.]